MNYKDTLNMMKTDFPMRASLPQREPEILKKWYEHDQYKQLMEVNKDKPLFVLHDGPPYANGPIHIGHALNKTLKDFVVRYKNMTGFKSPFVRVGIRMVFRQSLKPEKRLIFLPKQIYQIWNSEKFAVKQRSAMLICSVRASSVLVLLLNGIIRILH